ncbi:MAG: methyltransferase family protein [Paracoccaceae bacterium]|uniref:methyltransferase family protein n=1 Tax=Celeribacter marinus TaxID=1397108 RepID=UPI00317DA3D3
MEETSLYLGLGIAGVTLCLILWSIAFPRRRIWPPKNFTRVTPILVWAPTLSLFGILILLGILGWGSLQISSWVRFGIGIPLIIIGHFVVWAEVVHFGLPQTGGAKGALRTAGMYRFSRNPQYVADIAMVGGWMILSATPLAFVLGVAIVVILIATPFAEEPWLKEEYGSQYEEYKASTRRFL